MSENKDSIGNGCIVFVLILLAVGFVAYLIGDHDTVGAVEGIGGGLSIAVVVIGIIIWVIMWITGNTKDK